MRAAGKGRRELVHAPGASDLSVYGPNGFFREFGGAGPAIALRFIPSADRLQINIAGDPGDLELFDAYGQIDTPVRDRVLVGMSVYDHWYDVTLTSTRDKTFRRRLAGHIETGRPSKSDPLIGRA